jgi:Predicted ATP-dependent serine protease
MKADEPPVKNTSPAIPFKKCTTTDLLIWLDWSVLFTLVIVIVTVSPLGLLANAILCIVILGLYRIILRPIWIRFFPALYTVCSCSECAAVVPSGVDRCPQCNVWFAE